jgi:hypothetical protein
MKILTINEFNEQNAQKQVVKYRWRESFADIWHETKCEVLSHNDKTAVIKLLEFGKNGRRPGSQMRVHLKSLVGFDDGKPKQEPNDDWKKYTYFD